MKKAIVVFAKAPIAGQVKTRLIGTLTEEEAKDLYICFLKDTFELSRRIRRRSSGRKRGRRTFTRAVLHSCR